MELLAELAKYASAQSAEESESAGSQQSKAARLRNTGRRTFPGGKILREVPCTEIVKYRCVVPYDIAIAVDIELPNASVTSHQHYGILA